MFHFPSSEKEQEEGKERRLEGRGSRGGREGRREEVNEQYMSVERTEGREKKRKAKASGLMWAFFLTAIILQPTEFHQHKLC